MLTFIKKVYCNKRKDYHLLLGIFTVLTSFEFSFLAIYDAFTRFDFPLTARTALNGIPVLASSVSLVLCVFVAKYFIINKKQEFSILLLSGRKPKDLFIYLSIQFGLLTFIAFLIGILGGSAIMTLINESLKSLNISVYLQYQFLSVLLYSFLFFIFTFIFILAISAHQFVTLDTDLAKYLNHKSANEKASYIIKFSASSSKKKFPIMTILTSILCIYLAFYCISQLLNPNISFTNLLLYFTYALASVVVIVNSTIPLLYDLLHDSYLIKHPILMNSLSCFNEFSRTMSILVNLNVCIIPAMMFLLFFSSSNIIVQSIIFPCFIMMVIMMSLCFILRFSIYDQKRTQSIATLHAIGYSEKSLNTISFIKNLLFAFFAIIIPLAFLFELLWKAYLEGLLSYELIMSLAVCYAVIYLVVICYILIKERKTQKEVISNVKYLNRGQ